MLFPPMIGTMARFNDSPYPTKIKHGQTILGAGIKVGVFYFSSFMIP